MDNQEIFKNYTDLLRVEQNANSIHTQLLNYVRNGKSSIIRKNFAKPDFRDLMFFMAKTDINFAYAVFEFMLPQIARAAVEGGINELTVATVYLDYRKKAEGVDSGQELQNLLYNSLVEYADMVASLKNEKFPPLVQRCREYISGHLYEPINVNSIAKKLRVSRCYLSHAYKAGCGETIIERIHKEKIAAAEFLLTNSRFPLVDIAMHLGFSSQSHFTQVFDKEKGMTPHQYRESKKAQI